MGKKAKEHRKKVAKRNRIIEEGKKKQQKVMMDFLMKMINAEKQKGAFDGPVQPLPGEGPIQTNDNTISGPKI